MNEQFNTAKTRELNDRLRTTFEGGRVMFTQGVRSKGAAFLQAVVQQVQAFNGFTKDNDPYGEHDWGTFTLDGDVVNWKIDYYAVDLLHGSEAPWDEAVTSRVLTIMLMDEA